MKKPLLHFFSALDRFSSTKRIFGLFLITQALFSFMFLVTIPEVTSYANGLTILDLLPMGYTPETVIVLLQTLGKQGRSAYLWHQIPVDMIYPGFFILTYTLLMRALLKKVTLAPQWINVLSLFPIFAGLSDYLENIGIVSMILQFPSTSIALAHLTNLFSLSKSLFSMIAFVLILLTIPFLFIHQKKRTA